MLVRSKSFLSSKSNRSLSFAMTSSEDKDVLDHLPTLRDIPIGQLHQLATTMLIDEKAAKIVMRERLENMSKNAGIPVGYRLGPCFERHGTTAGVKRDTAGVLWLFVSSSPLPFIHVDLSTHSVRGNTVAALRRPCSPRPTTSGFFSRGTRRPSKTRI